MPPLVSNFKMNSNSILIFFTLGNFCLHYGPLKEEQWLELTQLDLKLINRRNFAFTTEGASFWRSFISK